VTFSGTSNLPLPSNLVVDTPVGGPRGTATYRFSTDGGATWSAPAPAAASVVLGSTGMTANFPVGTYNADNVYAGQGILSAPAVVLGSTGLSVEFGAGSYVSGQSWAAPYPVPRICFVWLTRMVTPEMYWKRGVNPQDPAIAEAEKLRDLAYEQIKEAADSKDGLYDLPIADNETTSAIAQGGPLGYSETSPYVWTDLEACRGTLEDANAGGTTQ